LYTALIQTRSSSKRLKNKVLYKILNQEVFKIVYKRVIKSKLISKAIILTTTLKTDDKIVKICKKSKIPYFRGNSLNVLKRYYYAAKKYNLKNIVRITSDCPLVDPEVIDKICKKYSSKKYHYVSNVLKPTYPDGYDVEIFNFNTLEKVYRKAKTKFEKEHVTTKMIKDKNLKKINIQLYKNYSNFRFTLDTISDFNKIKEIFEKEKSIYKPNLNLVLREALKKGNYYKIKRQNYF
tara:strand:- start:2407 stop:3114 length:708 start_codon:yes stop_codon:yes gene_type:complete